jgi:hypothetical protein
MRVRISFDALRLCLLVAAGVTSGYLWRAAFEASSPPEDHLAASPRLVEKAPAPPIVRIVPHHLTVAKHPAVVRQAAGRPVVRTQRAPAIEVSSHVASSPPAAGPSSTPPPPKSNPTPSPSPTPTPSTTTTTTSSPPAAQPVQQTPPPPPTTTTTPPTTQTPPPPTTSGDDGSRPGWGKGDENHDHTGPGGKKP